MTQEAFEEWEAPIKKFKRTNARVYEPTQKTKDVCCPDIFIDTAQKLHDCCLGEAGLPGLVMIYDNLLDFWTSPSSSARDGLHSQQYQHVLSDYNRFWNTKTESVELMIRNWPVCETCYKLSLGLSAHRWALINKTWETSVLPPCISCK